MPDPLAIWGALTGSAALSISLRREVIASRRRIRVDHGWQYVLSEADSPRLREMLVYIMVQNTGARDISLEHVGWEWPVNREKLESGQTVFDIHRAEIPLEDSILLKPDGAPVKVKTNVGPLLHLVDPLETPTWPVAFTHGGNTRWEGPTGTLAQRVPEVLGPDALREDLDRLKRAHAAPLSPARNHIYLVKPEWAASLSEGLAAENSPRPDGQSAASE